MQIGAEFSLYGIALSPDHSKIIVIRDIRVKTETASTLLRRETLPETFPNSRAGEKKAGAFVLSLNQEVVRLCALRP